MANETDTLNSNKSSTKKKKLRRNKTDLGPDFVAPDGGYAWIVCIACGIGNFVTLPMMQQFGLLFNNRFQELGFTNSQITSLINLNIGLSAFVGLFNGPVYRRFTFRQVGVAASMCLVSGILLCSICESFISYFFAYSLLYGVGVGLTVSSSALALNTYFKVKRRIATGFSWTITSFGPIVMPFFATYVIPNYGVFGSCLIFAAIAMNTTATSLIYQPVKWHIKKPIPKAESENVIDDAKHCARCKLAQHRKNSIFSSEYLFNSDDEFTPGFEILDPMPMLASANDGLFGSRTSLASAQRRTSLATNILKRRKSLLQTTISENSEIPLTTIRRENIPLENLSSSETMSHTRDVGAVKEKPANNFARRASQSQNTREIIYCTCEEEERKMLEDEKIVELNDEFEKELKKLSILEKFSLFFEFDLLKDFTYVTLMCGLTLANFSEINFAVLTPFILLEFGYASADIAFLLSLVGAMDSIVRFTIPFIAEKLGWQNKTFYLIGVTGTALGRMALIYSNGFYSLLACFVLIGLNKGMRTIFMALVLPTYVPLERLPAASGLQLLSAGLFSFAFGPVVGAIRDATNYGVVIHVLNIVTAIVVIWWVLLDVVQARRVPKPV